MSHAPGSGEEEGNGEGEGVKATADMKTARLMATCRRGGSEGNGNGGNGGNEAADGGSSSLNSSSSNSSSSTAVPAEHDGSLSRMISRTSRMWASAATANLAIAISSRGQKRARRASNIGIGTVALSARHSKPPAKAKLETTGAAAIRTSSMTEAKPTWALGSKELLGEQLGPQRRPIRSSSRAQVVRSLGERSREDFRSTSLMSPEKWFRGYM